MIRINLLPVRQERIQQYGKQQLFLGLLVIGLVCTGFFVHHSGNQSVLDERMEEISLIEQQVAQLETRTAELERLSTEKAQLETLASTL
ncbi:MAG: Tfp pilus assembly protein PilN, partial [Bradymonadia bacterium]